MFFKSRKKAKNDDKNPQVSETKPINVGELYLSYADNYIKYQGQIRGIDNPLDDKDFYQKFAGPFYNAAMYFVNYLESNISEEELNEDKPIDFDFEKMLDTADEEARNFFRATMYPNLIYLNDSKYSTHFHTDGEIIYEAEGIQVLPGLSGLLANERINKIFIGLTPREAKALLQQMGIYPKNTELDKVIKAVEERMFINTSFKKAIICLLLIKNNKYSLKRARLFADRLGIYFDFEPFEKEDKNILKKEL